jgi:hypothetical protein
MMLMMMTINKAGFQISSAVEQIRALFTKSDNPRSRFHHNELLSRGESLLNAVPSSTRLILTSSSFTVVLSSHQITLACFDWPLCLSILFGSFQAHDVRSKKLMKVDLHQMIGKPT